MGACYLSNDDAQVQINYIDGTKGIFANGFSKTASDWQYVAAEVKPKKAFNSVDVYYYFYNQTGTAWFDAMRLEVGASHTSYTYDAADQLTAVNGQAYTYDANGNLTNNGNKIFIYRRMCYGPFTACSFAIVYYIGNWMYRIFDFFA
jgi:hypothetical protein